MSALPVVPLEFKAIVSKRKPGSRVCCSRCSRPDPATNNNAPATNNNALCPVWVARLLVYNGRVEPLPDILLSPSLALDSCEPDVVRYGGYSAMRNIGFN